MDPLISLLSILVLLLTFVLVTLGTQVLRRQKRVQLALRPIPAYRTIPLVLGEAVESERPYHVSFGGSGLGADSTISALAVSDMLYPLAERAAVGSHPPIISVSDPTALGLAQGTLRRAYAMRNNLDAYRAGAARWYPQGPRSLAFAAGIGGAMVDEDVTMSVVAGRFGPEIAFIGETAARYDQMFFGQSDQLDGQAVAWVMSETPLIGEELYVAGAYLPRRPTALHLSQLVAMEGLRFLVILGILVAALISIAMQLLILFGVLLGGAAIILAVIFVVRYIIRRRRA